MVFGLFSRKSTQDDPSASSEFRTSDQNTRLPTPTPSIASVVHHSPLRFSTTFSAALGGSTTDPKDSNLATDSVAEGANNGHSSAPPPPVTPSPPPVGPNETKALYDLMLTIPPKTLHAYTISHLHPRSLLPLPSSSSAPASFPNTAPRPPSPNTVTKLATFFSTLAPPPLLHCIRCHKDFYEIENEEKDKACRVAHDDESALVSRVSGGGYETLWGCCGQTASGDGSEGPPDGWCYEGRHTTDIKRARFRADSTIQDDKLTSCLRLNCHGIRDRLPRRDSPARTVGASSARRSNASPVRSQASRSTRKRPRKSLKEGSGSEKEGDAESSTGRAVKAKPKEKVGGDAREGAKDASMAVDEPNPSSKPKTKVKSRPISRARAPASTSTLASLQAAGADVVPVASKAKTTTTKPKSTSRTLLSQSHTHVASDSEPVARSRPRTRSLVREESRGGDAPRSRATSKPTKAGVHERTGRTRKAAKPFSQSEEEPEAETDEYRETEQEGRGRDRKKRRVGRD